MHKKHKTNFKGGNSAIDSDLNINQIKTWYALEQLVIARKGIVLWHSELIMLIICIWFKLEENLFSNLSYR